MKRGPLSEETHPSDLDAQHAIEATRGADPWEREDVRRQSRLQPVVVSDLGHEFPFEVA